MPGTTTHIKFGNNLTVVDEGGGVIRVDAVGGSGGGGGGGAGATHVHTQGSPSALWVVPHTLGWWPSVTVVDTGESVVVPDVHYDSADQVTLAFGSPTSGKAYLNPGTGLVAPPASFYYVHDQTTASDTWTITHNLGRNPSVTVIDDVDEYVVADVIYVDTNQLQVKLASAITGRAHLV